MRHTIKIPLPRDKKQLLQIPAAQLFGIKLFITEKFEINIVKLVKGADHIVKWISSHHHIRRLTLKMPLSKLNPQSHIKPALKLIPALLHTLYALIQVLLAVRRIFVRILKHLIVIRHHDLSYACLNCPLTDHLQRLPAVRGIETVHMIIFQ